MAKLSAWLILALVLSTMTLATMAEVARPSAVPEHATIGLVAGLLLAILFAALGQVERRGRYNDEIGNMMRRGDTPLRWLHFRLRRTLVATLALVIVSGLLIAVLSPIAIRLWDTGFDLAQLGEPAPMFSAALAMVHRLTAMLLLAAVVAEGTLAVWRHVRLGDGALLRVLPFGVLWQRLAAQERQLRERMPSQNGANWPRGRAQ